MMKNIKICVLGASRLWSSGLATDLMVVFQAPLDVCFVDLDYQSAALCAEWGEAASRKLGRKGDRFRPFTSRAKALPGADAVIITLTTGGLDAMEQDIKIPEKYGIFAPVGASSGPAGWACALRNIPVFREFADDFQRFCPSAFITNYTNPMAALTATLQLCCANPAVGLCHAYFETKDFIQKIFELPDWSSISLSLAGVNHFTWLIDFKIGRKNGYALLKQKIGTGSMRDLLFGEMKDDAGHTSGTELCTELYDTFGYLPYPADRHTSEFLSFTLSGHPERYRLALKQHVFDTIRYHNIKRTSVEHRRRSRPKLDERMRAMIQDKVEMPKKSRETGAEMIHAYLYNRPFTDAVNALNKGQIPELPLNACVETLGTVDGFGVRPLLAQGMAPHLAELLRPPALVQQWTVDGVLKNDPELLLQALYRDPQCAQLKPHEIRQMAAELQEANKRFVPKK